MSERLQFALAGLLLGLGIGLLLAWRPGPAQQHAAAAATDPACAWPAADDAMTDSRARAARQRQPGGGAAGASGPAAADVDQRAAEAQHRREVSRDLVNSLHAHVLEALAVDPRGDNPEAAANYASPYVVGWLQAVTRAAPELSEAMSEAIQERMCAPQTSPAELIVLSRISAGTPDFASQAGLECVLNKHKNEDLVLWSALEAWQVAELPKTELIRSIEASARSPSTQLRLLPLKERLRQRDERVEQIRKLGADSAEPAELSAPSTPFAFTRSEGGDKP